MSEKYPVQSLLNPSQAELVQQALLMLLQSPQLPRRFKNGRGPGDLRTILARIVLALELQGPGDLQQFCDINNYDKISRAALGPINTGSRSLDLFRNVMKTLTVMRYQESTRWLKTYALKVPLTYGQLALQRLMLHAWTQTKHAEELQKYLQKAIRGAIGYFIYYRELEGPQDHLEFFRLSNYRKAIQAIEESDWFDRDQKGHRNIIQTLEYLHKGFVYSPKGGRTSAVEAAARLLQDVPLTPQEILADILKTVDLDSHRRTIRKARISRSKLDPTITRLIATLYRHKRTRQKVEWVLRSVLEYADIGSLAELRSYEVVERFYEQLKREGSNDGRIWDLFVYLASFMTKVIKNNLPVAGTYLTANHARTVMTIHQIACPSRKRNIWRSQDEVELWVSTLPTIEERALWALYAEGLRINEPLVREDDYTGRLVGLRWSQYDSVRRCLLNVRRKNTSEARKEHAAIRVSESTAHILNEHFNAQDNSDFMFSLDAPRVRRRYRKHFRRLQKWLNQLSSDSTADPKVLKTLRKLLTQRDEKTGEILLVRPHQFRHSWDTLAMNEMKDPFRIYHMNHAQPGGDATYLHFSDPPDAYFEEYDRAAPKYNFNFALAKEVYPERFKGKAKAQTLSDLEKADINPD